MYTQIHACNYLYLYTQYTIAISKQRGNEFEGAQEYIEQDGRKKRRGFSSIKILKTKKI